MRYSQPILRPLFSRHSQPERNSSSSRFVPAVNTYSFTNVKLSGTVVSILLTKLTLAPFRVFSFSRNSRWVASRISASLLLLRQTLSGGSSCTIARGETRTLGWVKLGGVGSPKYYILSATMNRSE